MTKSVHFFLKKELLLLSAKNKILVKKNYLERLKKTQSNMETNEVSGILCNYLHRPFSCAWLLFPFPPLDS